MPLNHTAKYAELTPRQFEAIGRLVVEWSNIELLLGIVLSRLLHTPEFLGRVYTDELMAVRMQSAIEKAMSIHRNRYGCRLVPEDVLTDIASLNSEVERIRGTRNKLSHFCWCRSNDEELFGSGLSGHVPPSKKLDKDSIVVSLTELDEMYKHSYAVVSRLSELVAKLPEVPEQ
jgi:hypothetical protein